MTDAPERLAVFWHPAALDYDTGEGFFEAPPQPFLSPERHPESRERIAAIYSVLTKGPLAPLLDWHDGREATRAEMERYHTAAHLDALQAASNGPEPTWFGPSTPFFPGSWRPVACAAGATLEALDAVLSGRARKAYALVRPPGHHAARAQADGYCFVNNLAVAVETAIADGLARIAVIDWDVHHGNGTQTGFYDRDDVLTISLHMPHGSWGDTHPETGLADEVGTGRGLGYNINLPMPFGAGDAGYEYAMRHVVRPAVEAFRPDLIVLAAGQDANQFDPNGRQCLTMKGFHTMGGIVRDLAEKVCGGRMLITQEGGYQASYAAFCTHAALAGVIGAPIALPDPVAYMDDGLNGIEGVLAEQAIVRDAAIKAAA